jgi:hypothetical protein
MTLVPGRSEAEVLADLTLALTEYRSVLATVVQRLDYAYGLGVSGYLMRSISAEANAFATAVDTLDVQVFARVLGAELEEQWRSLLDAPALATRAEQEIRAGSASRRRR